jgi:hypothetical protein
MTFSLSPAQTIQILAVDGFFHQQRSAMFICVNPFVVELIFPRSRSICSNTILKGTLILGPEPSAPERRRINCEEVRHHSPLPCGSLMWQRNNLGATFRCLSLPFLLGRSHGRSPQKMTV